MKSIPFVVPHVDDAESDSIQRVIEERALRGDGPVSKEVEGMFKEWLEVDHFFLTTSCTHAIEISTLVMDLGPGDEVIMPSFTFVSNANAVVLRGATPVFAEIKMDTLNLDPEDVARKITPRTKAVFPVHYGGTSCDMDALIETAGKDILIVEDAAQAVDAKYKGRNLGAIGDMGCFSFHDTKNLTSGEGGAFLTNNASIAEKVEIIREKGTNRSAFLNGRVDKYTWVGAGSSYIQSDILAAVLRAQLHKRSEIKNERSRVWNRYFQGLTALETDRLQLPHIPDYCESNFHCFFVRAENEKERNELLGHLRKDGIQATFHYIPLHSSPYGRGVIKNQQELPNTDLASATIIRLPLYPSLTDEDVDYIIDSISNYLNSN